MSQKKVYRKPAAKKAPYKAPVKKAAPRRQYQQKESGSIGRSILNMGGAAGASFLGLPPSMGKMAGDGLATVLGLGDYKIKKNAFLSGRLPKMMNMPAGGGTVIRFEEYLTDIFSTPNIGNPAEFNIQSFLINPANVDCFPWLSQIAANYEQYYIEGMLFQFRSTSGDALNSTNTALGSVMLATQYDVADPLFRTKAEMLNYEFANSIKPSDNCIHMIECAPNQSVLSGLYTLDGAAPAGADSRFYHLGRFCIATVGFQAANVNIGQLHVSYQVRLLKPKLYSSLGNASDFAYLIAQGGSSYTNANPLAGNFILSSQSNFTCAISGGTCTLPASSIIKTYRIEVQWTGSGAVAQALVVPTVANCTLLQNTLQAGTNTQALTTFLISTTGNSKASSFSFSAQTLATGPLECILRIMQVPQAITI